MTQRTLAVATLLATTTLTAPAFAQSAAGAATAAPATQIAQAGSTGAHANVLEEVVVTAVRRRNENVQSTPIAVTALTGEMLERAHVSTFSQVGDLAPNLQVDKNLGTAGVSNIYLRGFGEYSNDPAVDPHVAVFFDGVYLPSPSGTLFDVFDIGTLEVQAGPQGTLLGKNAPIGAVYITSAKPTGDFGGEIQGDYGSYDHYGLHARINVPIIKGDDGSTFLAARASLAYKEGGNWVKNLANGKRDMGGENVKSGRISVALTPDTRFEWHLTASGTKDDDPQNGSHPASFMGGFAGTPASALQIPPFPCNPAVGGSPALCPALPYGTTNSTFTARERDWFTLVSSTMSYHFDPVTVTAVTGYNGYWLVDNSDDTGTPYVALNAYNDRTRYDEETQEIRLSSNKGGGWDLDGKLDWVVGGYLSNFDYNFGNNLGIGVLGGFAVPIGVVNTRQNQHGTTQSEALFAHMIYNFTEQWNGTFGVRQSWDHKTHWFQSSAPPTPGFGPYTPDTPAGWHNTSFEVGTAYQFDSNHMGYFRFAQGYQSGGYSGFATGDIFNPETNNAYEIGFKSDWLEHRLRVNLDLFINELSDLQVESALSIPTPPFFLQETLNAGSATVEGMEAQIVARPLNDLTTHMNVGYLHTKFNKNFSTTCSNTLAATDCSGLPFAMAPKWTFSLGGDYVRDLPKGWGTAIFSANWYYRSSLYTSDPVYPSSLQNGYGLVNLSLTLTDPSDKYSVEFFGTNVLDRRYRSGYTDPSGLGAWEKQGEPAMWGIRLTAKFGRI